MKHDRCSFRPPTRAGRASQSGIVLLIALVLLVIIGFSSAFILRGSLFGDQISSNIKSTQAAQHAAEVALRFCERRILAPVAGAATPIIPEPEDEETQAIAWQSQDNWDSSAITVTASVLQSDSNAQAVSYNQLPQCLIERLPIRTNADPGGKYKYAFQITSRGYSADYSRADNGNITSGSEVILQMVLRMKTCSPLLGQDDCT